MPREDAPPTFLSRLPRPTPVPVGTPFGGLVSCRQALPLAHSSAVGPSACGAAWPTLHRLRGGRSARHAALAAARLAAGIEPQPYLISPAVGPRTAGRYHGRLGSYEGAVVIVTVPSPLALIAFARHQRGLEKQAVPARARCSDGVAAALGAGSPRCAPSGSGSASLEYLTAGIATCSCRSSNLGAHNWGHPSAGLPATEGAALQGGPRFRAG